MRQPRTIFALRTPLPKAWWPRPRRCLPLAVLLLGAVGCGAEDGEPATVEEVPQALGEATCASAVPDRILFVEGPVGSIAHVESPTTYSNTRCTKTWVVESSAQVPNPTGSGSAFIVEWFDQWDRNKTQCVNGSLSVQVMSKQFDSEPYVDNGTLSAKLRWNNAVNRCEFPSLLLTGSGGSWISGWDYSYHDVFLDSGPRSTLANLDFHKVELAVSARTPAGSTQSVKVSFYPHSQ